MWQEEYRKACSIYDSIQNNIEFSDLQVFDYLLKNIDDHSDLHVANSSPIRYQQLFNQKSLNTYCNRGTSGIDGCSSTALGFSIKNDKDTWLITGDVSFLYDSNAWWNNYQTSLKIILINNGGGGIFRIIPGPQSTPDFNTYFETQHKVNMEHLCKAFDLTHFKANNMDSLAKGLNNLKDHRGMAVLEINTPREKNAVILNDYFDLLRKGSKRS